MDCSVQGNSNASKYIRKTNDSLSGCLVCVAKMIQQFNHSMQSKGVHLTEAETTYKLIWLGLQVVFYNADKKTDLVFSGDLSTFETRFEAGAQLWPGIGRLRDLFLSVLISHDLYHSMMLSACCFSSLLSYVPLLIASFQKNIAHGLKPALSMSFIARNLAQKKINQDGNSETLAMSVHNSLAK